jgi:hypothetical protein
MTLDEHDSDHKNYEMMVSTLKPTKWKLATHLFITFLKSSLDFLKELIILAWLSVEEFFHQCLYRQQTSIGWFLAACTNIFML